MEIILLIYFFVGLIISFAAGTDIDSEPGVIDKIEGCVLIGALWPFFIATFIGIYVLHKKYERQNRK